MKIAYLVDSSISINDNKEFLEQEDVFCLPLHIVIDNVDYIDDGTLNRKEIIDLMKKAKNASTSQPSYGEAEEVLDEIISKGYDVIVCACIGSGLSGTQNLIYSCGVDKKLTIVNLDSKGVGPMNVHAITMFKELLAQGGSLLDIQAKVQHMLDVSHCHAVVDDLMYLKKGGRISSSSALVGTLLKVKPIVMCAKDQGGKVVSVTKERTRKKAYEKMVSLALENIDADEYNIAIGSFDSDEHAEQLKETIKKVSSSHNVDILELSYVIGIHTGPGTLVLFTVRK